MTTQYNPLYNHQDNYGQWGHFETPTLNTTGLFEDPLFTKIMPVYEKEGEPGTVSNMVEMHRLEAAINHVTYDVIKAELSINGQTHVLKQNADDIHDAHSRITQLETQIQEIRDLVGIQTSVIADLKDTINQQEAKILNLRTSPSSSPLKKKQKSSLSAYTPSFAPKPRIVTYASVARTGQIIMPALSL